MDDKETQIWRDEVRDGLRDIKDSLSGKGPDEPGLISKVAKVNKTLYGNGTPGLVQRVEELRTYRTWITHGGVVVATALVTACVMKLFGLK